MLETIAGAAVSVLITYLTASGVASHLAAFLPRVSGNGLVAAGLKLVDFLAANYLNARNATARCLAVLALGLGVSACSPGATGNLTLAQVQSMLVPGLICALDTAGRIEAVATTDDSDAHKAVAAAVVAGAMLAGDASCVAAAQAVASRM